MSYPAAAIANQLLDRAEQSGRQLTQIEIQKLVYFAHGWHLGLKHQPLVQEPIEAWQYGPVVRRLYDAFRQFGTRAISKKAVEYSYSSSGQFVASEPTISSPDVEADAYATSVVGAVWEKFGTLAPFKLVELTHAPGSPWERAWKEQRTVISTSEIEQYFTALVDEAV
jgi:uncharacterized phage-associated protein